VFDLNGGTFIDSNYESALFDSAEYEVRNGNTFGRAFPPVRRPGHRFVGWFDTSERTGGTRIHADTPINENMHLYARWVETSTLDNFQLGSISGNGRVTTADATALARLLLEHGRIILNENSPTNFLAADLNGDGYITLADLTLFARWIVGHNVQVSLC
jgi:uncharacterized repeat protein (TIGR02543 family)